jgi:hypothetical protein
MRRRALGPPGYAFRGIAPALSVAVGLWGLPCAAASCPVEVSGPASERWVLAVRSIEAPSAAPGDCGHIRLDVGDTGARLLFVTRDGRRAERELDHPDELAPTVLALGVTGVTEDELPELPLPDLRHATDRAAPLEAVPASTLVSPPEDARAFFSFHGGTRFGSNGLMSPVLGAAASIALRRWELGVSGAFDVQYFDLGRSVEQAPSSALCAGVSVGRREPIGFADLAFGARLMLAALNDESQKDSGERGRAELRLGAYVGAAFGSRGSTRFRTDLVVDFVPHDVVGALGTPITPRLAVSALFGMEVGP